MHGSNLNNENADNVTSCSSTAPLYKMLHYSQDAKIKNDPTRTITVSASETLKHQQEVELYYNENVLKKEEVAEKHTEALDIVTPNAFFAGLKNKDDGKNLFLVTIKETAKSLNVSKDFKGLFIHGHNFNDQKDFKFLIRENKRDAGAPAKIAKNLKCNFTLATCVMGEALGAAGNGAFGKYGNQAMEEDLTRRSFGGVAWIFGPQFNPALLDATKYKDISSNLPTVQSINRVN